MSQSIKRKLMALVVVGAMAIPMVSFADIPLAIPENEATVISEKEEASNQYIKRTGEITEAIDNEGNISILVKSDEEDEYGMLFHISEDVSLWNRHNQELVKTSDLKVGMDVDVFFNENTPTAMSLPPQLTPAVILVQEEANEPTFMGEFDSDLVSTDNRLKLNIGEDTVILGQKGQPLTTEDIAGNTALVFFDMSTKSIPAQTTPSKVIVFTEKEEAVEEDTEEIEDGAIGIEEVKEMISLRDTATELGYKVQWDNEAKRVEISKQNQMIAIEVGSIDYTLNRSLGKFFKAPELRNDTLYVSASVLDFME